MNGSLKIGTAFGIPIRIHWTFAILPSVLVALGTPFALAVLLIVVLFGCVFLHELGHSLVARGFGIRVLDISFWPLGGMARMSEIPENPRIEGLVAIAGPAVNFALAGLGVFALLLTQALGLSAAFGPCLWFTLVNLTQGTFNLIPAFPMDGGRILRAFLGRKRDWVSATEIAVKVGRVCAGLMLVASIVAMLLAPSVCLLPLIAVFVWIAGARELLAVRMRHGMSPFGRAFPGAAGFGQPASATADAAPSEPPAGAGSEEPGAARRPLAWEPEAPRGGFSEDAVRWLERYRGRLRHPPPE